MASKIQSACFVVKYDSSLKASIPLIEKMKAEGIDVEIMMLHEHTDALDAQFRELGLRDRARYGVMEDVFTFDKVFDVYHLVLPGHVVREFTYLFRDKFKGADIRPVVVVGLVGLLAGKETDCYVSRQMADIIYVGTHRDKRMLDEVARKLGTFRDEQVVATGLPIYGSMKHLEPSNDKSIVFAGQPTFPKSKVDRAYIVERLLDLAEAYPDREIILKPRHRLDESTFHKVQFHFETLLEGIAKKRAIPANFSVSYEPIDKMMAKADLTITISSTAGIEALYLKKNVCILADFSITEAYGNHFFLGSGLIRDFNQLIAGDMPKIDPDWQRDNILFDQDVTANLLRVIEDSMSSEYRSRMLDTVYFDHCDGIKNYRENFKADKLAISDRPFQRLVTKGLVNLFSKTLAALRSVRLGERMYQFVMRLAIQVYRRVD